MRGKVSIFSPPNYNIRITPAYAGKSLGVGVLWIHDKDHPRLCGEKFLLFSFEQFRIRITPAYAGKRVMCRLSKLRNQDHPRLCGEKHVFPALAVLVLGSPPPMRGKETTPFTVSRMVRITPAYAGKSYISDRYRFPR